MAQIQKLQKFIVSLIFFKKQFRRAEKAYSMGTSLAKDNAAYLCMARTPTNCSQWYSRLSLHGTELLGDNFFCDMEIATVESDELLCKAEYRYGDARVGVGEVFDAFYGGYVNRALIGYQRLSNSHCPSCSASQGGYLSNFAKQMKEFFGF